MANTLSWNDVYGVSRGDYALHETEAEGLTTNSPFKQGTGQGDAFLTEAPDLSELRANMVAGNSTTSPSNGTGSLSSPSSVLSSGNSVNFDEFLIDDAAEFADTAQSSGNIGAGNSTTNTASASEAEPQVSGVPLAGDEQPGEGASCAYGANTAPAQQYEQNTSVLPGSQQPHENMAHDNSANSFPAQQYGQDNTSALHLNCERWQHDSMGAGNTAYSPAAQMQQHAQPGPANAPAPALGGAPQQPANMFAGMSSQAPEMPVQRPAKRRRVVAPFVPAQQPAPSAPAPAPAQAAFFPPPPVQAAAPAPAPAQYALTARGAPNPKPNVPGNRSGQMPGWPQALKHHHGNCKPQEGGLCNHNCPLLNGFPVTFQTWVQQRFRITWHAYPQLRDDKGKPLDAKKQPKYKYQHGRDPGDREDVDGFFVAAMKWCNQPFRVEGELDAAGNLNKRSKTALCMDAATA